MGCVWTQSLSLPRAYKDVCILCAFSSLLCGQSREEHVWVSASTLCIINACAILGILFGHGGLIDMTMHSVETL